MKATRLVSTLFAALLAGCYAGTPPENPAGDSTKNTVVVTGCLQKEASTDTFVLVNVQASPEAGAEQTTRYLLKPGSIDLKDHVGHKVEVTGNVVRELARTDPAGAGDSKDATPRIDVVAVKHVADCP